MHMFDKHASNTKEKKQLRPILWCGNLYEFEFYHTFVWMYAIFVKVFQVQNVFIYDFVDVVKTCEGDFYRLYVNPITSYGHGNDVFKIFLPIVHHSYDPLHMVWIF